MCSMNLIQLFEIFAEIDCTKSMKNERRKKNLVNRWNLYSFCYLDNDWRLVRTISILVRWFAKESCRGTVYLRKWRLLITLVMDKSDKPRVVAINTIDLPRCLDYFPFSRLLFWWQSVRWNNNSTVLVFQQQKDLYFTFFNPFNARFFFGTVKEKNTILAY